MTTKKFFPKRAIFATFLLLLAAVFLVFNSTKHRDKHLDIVETSQYPVVHDAMVNKTVGSLNPEDLATLMEEAATAVKTEDTEDRRVFFFSKPESPLLRGKDNVMVYPELVRSVRTPIEGSVFKQPIFKVHSTELAGDLTMTEKTKSAVEAQMDLDAVRAFLLSDAQYLAFPLSASESVLLNIQKVEEQGLHSVALVGQVKGRLDSQVRLIFHDGAVAGAVELLDDQLYFELGMAGNGDVAIRLLDMEKDIYGECISDAGSYQDKELMDEVVAQGENSQPQLFSSATAATAALTSGYAAIIDGVVGYTTKVKNGAGGTAAIEAKIVLSTGFINDALLRSEITNTFVNLLGTVEEVGHSKGLANTFEDIKTGQLAVNALRTTLGADYAAVVYNGGGGVATMNGLYYVTGANTLTSAGSVVHEFGHILGCAHAWADTEGTLVSDPEEHYYGWRFKTSEGTKIRTLMSYTGGWATQRIAYYSNPDVSYQGGATGVVNGFNASGNTDIDPQLVSGGAAGTGGAGYDGTNPLLGADNHSVITENALSYQNHNSRQGANILQPTAYTIYYIGREEQISWLGGDHTQSVEIELYQGGVLHSPIAAVSGAHLRWYDWTIPDVPEADDYSVRVTLEGGAILEKGPFTIRQVRARADDLSIKAISGLAVDITLPTVEGLTLGYIYEQPMNGTLTGTAPNLVYVPHLGATSDSFNYNTTYDDLITLETSETATVSITMFSEVAHWPLDDGSGTVVTDVSGNGHHGTFTATVDPDTWEATGQVDGALRFNGDTDSVTLPAAAFSGMTDEMTLSMWIYGDGNQPTNDNLFHMIDGDGDTIMTMLIGAKVNTDVANYWFTGLNGNYINVYKNANDSVFKGQWNHYVFMKNASSREMKLYINGALSAQISNSYPVSGAAEVYLGSYNSSLSSYNGMIDNVRLYDVEMTASGVQKLYQIEFGIAPVADSQTVSVAKNDYKSITLTSPSLPVSYTVVSYPVNGVLFGTAPNLIYTPNADYTGDDSFTFRVNDGVQDSATATVSITVTNVSYIFDSLSNSGTPSTITSSNGKGINFTVPAGSDRMIESVFLRLGSIDSGAVPVISIWSDEGDVTPILALLETLTNPTTLIADSVNSFASSGLVLEAGKTYWIVARGANTNKWYWDGASDAVTVGTNTARVFGGSGSEPSTWSSVSSVLNAAAVIYSSNDDAAPFEAWLAAYPTLSDVNFNGDPDQDGIVTGLEYVLAGDPTRRDDGDVTLPEVDAAGENFVFTFTRLAPSAADTMQVFQYSSTLEFDDWTDVSITEPKAIETSLGPVVDGLQTVTVTISKSLAEGDSLFGRLKVLHEE